jgi:hypothetical protein
MIAEAHIQRSLHGSTTRMVESSSRRVHASSSAAKNQSSSEILRGLDAEKVFAFSSDETAAKFSDNHVSAG